MNASHVKRIRREIESKKRRKKNVLLHSWQLLFYSYIYDKKKTVAVKLLVVSKVFSFPHAKTQFCSLALIISFGAVRTGVKYTLSPTESQRRNRKSNETKRE